MGGSRGDGQGVRTPHPMKHQKNIGFLSNTGSDPMKLLIAKLSSQHLMLGPHWHCSETLFKWRFAGVPMIVRLQWYADPLSPHQLKNVVKVGPPLTKLSGPAHGRLRLCDRNHKLIGWLISLKSLTFEPVHIFVLLTKS